MIFFYGNSDMPVLADQQRRNYISFVWTQDAAENMMGMDGKRDSRSAMLSAQIDDIHYYDYLVKWHINSCGLFNT